jgi:hypothetical protein
VKGRSPATSSLRRAAAIADVIARYRTRQHTSDLELLKRLHQINDQATGLTETLASLVSDSRTTHAISSWPLGNGIHPSTFNKQLQQFLLQIKYAIRQAPKPRRGPRNQDPLRQLVAELGILWAIDNPGIKGVAAHRGEYRGPMVEFVWKRLQKANRRARRLRQERLPIRSKQSLAKMLFNTRRSIAQHATTARRRQADTQKFASSTVTTLS